ncbi:hypothetical protein LTR87_017040 [Friedmanniomyces endolithicus]|nr:hypothetical protein LTR87_017040 [Friedmanniomyces endolithicus]
MGATRLPLELQQQIYAHLDTRSFHAARNVFRYWRLASLDAVTLSRQLHKLPILSPPNTGKSNLQELQSPRISARWLLDGLHEVLGTGSTSAATEALALSASGMLLVVARGRIIWINDLVMGPFRPLSQREWISGAAGHTICGLDFEQNDSLLRVRLSEKGTVLYLGTPVVESFDTEAGAIEHWKSRPGLWHTFLDSRLLVLPGAQDATSDHARRLSGIQLLRPFRDGFLFAAQQHGGNESSHYVLAHITCSYVAARDTQLLTADPDGVMILARLESFLSAWSYTLNGKNENGVGLWENMPSAHEHHPMYALSPDSTMLVVAERDQKVTRPIPLTQLFLYRLPGERRTVKMLEEHEEEKRAKQATLSGVLEKPASKAADVSGMTEGGTGFKVARIPLCSSTIRGAVTELKFERAPEWTSDPFVVTACTAETVRRWTVTEP